MKYKKLIIALLVAFTSSVSLAEEKAKPKTYPVVGGTEIKLEGFFDFQAGYGKQTHVKGNAAYITDNMRNTAFYTEAAFFATIQHQIGDVIGGLKLVLTPTTRPKTSTGYNGSHIFLETNYGKVEVGSPADASAKMRVTGYKVVAASGTAWNKYIILNSDYMKFNDVKPDFDTSDNFYMSTFTNNFDDMSDKAEPARKVSYYTPSLEGFRFGISYTPDSSNTGGNRNLNNLTTQGRITGVSKSRTGIQWVLLPANQLAVVNQNVKNAFGGGISYSKEFSDDLVMELSLTGEYGKPARDFKLINNPNTPQATLQTQAKLTDLKAYNLGAVLSYGNFSYAASYGNLGKSLTTPAYHKAGRKTEYYNGAIAYGQGPIKTSVSYFKSSRYKNTIDAVSVGTEYLVIPGLSPYAEVSCFQAKGKPVYYPDAPYKKTRGTVGIIGTKIKF